MNKTLVITTGTTSEDKYIKLKLEQDIETLNILSLNISTSDVYQDFNSDYGILIGRVNGNDSVGIPNAKISIFIPLSDADSLDSEISGIYPYTTPRIKNADGKRYNLLPRIGKSDPITGIIAPTQPFGSFPIKEEIVTNIALMNVYKKYYKYTAVTNDSGDYMIFGVPIGTQTVHMSVDITDIGKYSMTPAAMVVNLGYSPNLFNANKTRIKKSNDLADLPNIETQDISVNIISFWGDTANYEIGITRQDFRIRSVLANTVTIFGSVFTDGELSMWGRNSDNDRAIRELYSLKAYQNNFGLDASRINVGISSKRSVNVTEKIYYYPSSVTDEYILANNAIDISDEMILLDKNEYSVYNNNGSFAFIINCNRNKIITDKSGNSISVPDDYNGGIYTEFRGFATFEINDVDAPLNIDDFIGDNTWIKAFRYKLKVPQFAVGNNSFTMPVGGTESPQTIAWRKQDQIFKGGSYYSVAKFHGLVYNNEGDDNNQTDEPSTGYIAHDDVNIGIRQYTNNVGIIQTDDSFFNDVTGLTTIENSKYFLPSNIGADTSRYFGGNWLNFSLHMPQVGYCHIGSGYIKHMKSTTNFSRNYRDPYFYENNDQQIAATDTNTKGFARSDLHYTSFIEVNKEDLKKIVSLNNGFKMSDLTATGITLTTTDFKNGLAQCPLDRNGVSGGRINSDPSQSIDTDTYFFKGLGSSDCFKLLRDIGII